MLRTALTAAQERFPNAAVWSVPCIKPINVKQLVGLARDRSAVVVMEEHSVYGGLGSLVAEILSERLPVPVLRIGVSDRFSQHCGTYDYLLREHGLDKPSVEKKIDAFLSTLKVEAS
jgi:transketolase